jgi:hypothetical protein
VIEEGGFSTGLSRTSKTWEATPSSRRAWRSISSVDSHKTSCRVAENPGPLHYRPVLGPSPAEGEPLQEATAKTATQREDKKASSGHWRRTGKTAETRQLALSRRKPGFESDSLRVCHRCRRGRMFWVRPTPARRVS